MHARLTQKIPKIPPATMILAFLEKCGFSLQIASCGHTQNALMAVPKGLLKTAILMKFKYFI